MLTWTHWAAVRLYNGLGRYADALAAARQVSEPGAGTFRPYRPLPELVEAAVRTGRRGMWHVMPSNGWRQWTQAGGIDWALGIEAQVPCAGDRWQSGRALVPGGDPAVQPYTATPVTGPRPSAIRGVVAT